MNSCKYSIFLSITLGCFLIMIGSFHAMGQSVPRGIEDEGVQQARVFVDLLNQGNYETARAMFSAEADAIFYKGMLEQRWTGLVKHVGALQAIESFSLDSQELYTIVDFQARFENLPLTIRVTLDRQNQVASLFFRPAAPPPYDTKLLWVLAAGVALLAVVYLIKA